MFAVLLLSFAEFLTFVPAGTLVRPQEFESLHPLVVVELCAERSLPCGLEIKESDARAARRIPKPDTPEGRQLATASMSDLVTGFNTRNLNYQAVIVEGVLVIRPIGRVAGYLAKDSEIGSVKGRGLMLVAEKLFLATANFSGGRLGSLIGPAGIEIDRGDKLEFDIAGAGRSVLGVLNEIVRKAPGHAWFVTTTNDDSPKVLSFGFVHRLGVTTEESTESPK